MAYQQPWTQAHSTNPIEPKLRALRDIEVKRELLAASYADAHRHITNEPETESNKALKNVVKENQSNIEVFQSVLAKELDTLLVKVSELYVALEIAVKDTDKKVKEEKDRIDHENQEKLMKKLAGTKVPEKEKTPEEKMLELYQMMKTRLNQSQKSSLGTPLLSAPGSKDTVTDDGEKAAVSSSSSSSGGPSLSPDQIKEYYALLAQQDAAKKRSSKKQKKDSDDEDD